MNTQCVYNLEDKTSIHPGQIVSEIIINNKFVDISLFSFSGEEGIEFEKSAFDRIYFLIEGTMKLETPSNEHILSSYSCVEIAKNTDRQIYSKNDYILIMITLKEENNMIKNIEKEKVLNLVDEINYENNKIVSKSLASSDGLSITLLAFDGKQELSTHSAASDALVIALDGEARININGTDYTLKKGNSIILPANIPHGVYVDSNYKMILIK